MSYEPPLDPSSLRSFRAQPIITQLDAEWRHITSHRRELGIATSWNLLGRRVLSLDEVLVWCGYRPRSRPTGGPIATQDEMDQRLLRLVEIAATDQLAARIVLQRLLPALCSLARRWSHAGAQNTALLDDLILNAWPIIVAYPTTRRPRFVASNLVHDIGFQTIVRPQRRASHHEQPTPEYQLDQPEVDPNPEPLIELVALIRAARQQGRISDRDVETLCALVSVGTADRLARQREVSARTVRNHRDAIIHRLRQFIAVA